MMDIKCHWAALDGNGTTTWADAHLTLAGITQALAVSAFWSHQLTSQKMPLPQSYYVSPLSRALHTAQLTFSSLPAPPKHPFHPVVKELLREANGIHTCDRRSSRTYIASNYPKYYTIEPGFSEEDMLWVPDLRESDSALTARLRQLLDDVFSHDESMFISMTSHGGAIAAILRVVGHRPFSLRTGAVVPVLVRVERVSGEKPKMDIEPWTPMPRCS
jgi:broad specificity phosphatase PhoE